MKNRNIQTWSSFNLHGEVISLKESEFNFDSPRSEFLLFNNKGWLIEKKIFDKYGNSIEGVNYKYDKNEIIIEFFDGRTHRKSYNNNDLLVKDIWHNSNGSLDYQSIYKYDDLENLVELDASDSKSGYKYNDQGKLIESIICNLDESLISKHSYKYDDKGNLAEKNNRYPDCNNNTQVIYRYDNNGKMIEELNLDSFGNSDKKIYKYDDKGNLLEKHRHRGGRYDHFIYNEEGKKVEEISFEENVFFNKFTNKYDDYGNLIKEKWYDFSDRLIRQLIYKYVYDGKGNWIVIHRFENNIQDETTERKITYFA